MSRLRVIFLFLLLSSALFANESPKEVYSYTYQSDSIAKIDSLVVDDADFKLKVLEHKEYRNPAVEIISQDTEWLKFSLLWEDDLDVFVEVVSIIGNSFFAKVVKYQGNELELSVRIDTLVTGIYLLKVTDENDNMVIRKFTKY